MPHPGRLLLMVPLALALLAWTLWVALLPAAVTVVSFWLSAFGVLLSLLWFRLAPLLTLGLALITLAVLVPLATLSFAMTAWLMSGFAP